MCAMSYPTFLKSLPYTGAAMPSYHSAYTGKTTTEGVAASRLPQSLPPDHPDVHRCGTQYGSVYDPVRTSTMPLISQGPSLKVGTHQTASHSFWYMPPGFEDVTHGTYTGGYLCQPTCNNNSWSLYTPSASAGNETQSGLSHDSRIDVTGDPKPNFSYIGLIAKAILSTEERRMILSEIYQWIQMNYPYFRSRGPGWRNSIRHNLSLNDCFIKIGRAANGKGHYWGIHPANLHDFLAGDFRRRRAQRKVRQALGLACSHEDHDSPSPDSPTLVPEVRSSSSPLLDTVGLQHTTSYNALMEPNRMRMVPASHASNSALSPPSKRSASYDRTDWGAFYGGYQYTSEDATLSWLSKMFFLHQPRQQQMQVLPQVDNLSGNATGMHTTSLQTTKGKHGFSVARLLDESECVHKPRNYSRSRKSNDHPLPRDAHSSYDADSNGKCQTFSLIKSDDTISLPTALDFTTSKRRKTCP
ncbi:unnamed protein product [Dicrocoelium dendriticum]|nr:unnamed protein product [Dicrocoelium dendriticum]